MKISAIKKMCITSLSLVLLFINVTIPAYASDKNAIVSDNNAKIATTLIISDPKTGHVWKWDIPNSDVSISSSILSPSLDVGEKKVKTAVSVDVTKYLNTTFATTVGQSTTKNDDITMSTGLTYATDASENSISIYNVFGSTTPIGFYYATNRVVYWRNPGAGVGNTLNPSSNSWNYSTDSTAGGYNSSQRPYSILTCNINISGMTAYRTVSVECQVP